VLKSKLREEYPTEANLILHRDELVRWVSEALYPDNQLLESTYKDKFKDKCESLFTGLELDEKEKIMKKRKKRKVYLTRFFNELVAVYKTIGVGNTIFQLVQQEMGADNKKGPNSPYETAINLKPPFYILLVGPPMSGKPVSTALNLKAAIASPIFTGTVSGITKSMVGLTNADDTTDAGKPVSTAQQSALDCWRRYPQPTLSQLATTSVQIEEQPPIVHEKSRKSALLANAEVRRRRSRQSDLKSRIPAPPSQRNSSVLCPHNTETDINYYQCLITPVNQ
jgi:hypothetical protein